MGNEIGQASSEDLEFQKFLENFIKKKIAALEHFILVEKNHIDDVIRMDHIFLHTPHIAGIPITFAIGDMVNTPDGKEGKVLGSLWMPNLVLFESNKPFAGYFVVKVDTGDKISYYIRQQLKGEMHHYGL